MSPDVASIVSPDVDVSDVSFGIRCLEISIVSPDVPAPRKSCLSAEALLRRDTARHN